MYLGTNNKNLRYKLEKYRLETTEEKTLGVLVNYRMTMSCQHDAAMKNANAILGHIR